MKNSKNAVDSERIYFSSSSTATFAYRNNKKKNGPNLILNKKKTTILTSIHDVITSNVASIPKSSFVRDSILFKSAGCTATGNSIVPDVKYVKFCLKNEKNFFVKKKIR